jgi:hypothetical protein
MRRNYFGAPIENWNAAFALGFPLQQAPASSLDHLRAILDQIAVERHKRASAREHHPLDAKRADFLAAVDQFELVDPQL